MAIYIVIGAVLASRICLALLGIRECVWCQQDDYIPTRSYVHPFIRPSVRPSSVHRSSIEHTLLHGPPTYKCVFGSVVFRLNVAKVHRFLVKIWMWSTFNVAFFFAPASLLAFTLGIGGVDVMMLIHLNVWIWLAPAVFSFVFGLYTFFFGAQLSSHVHHHRSPVQFRSDQNRGCFVWELIKYQTNKGTLLAFVFVPAAAVIVAK